MTRDQAAPTSAELRRRVLEQTPASASPFGDPIALAEDWRIRADHADSAAAAYRLDGDTQIAGELEQTAVDYRVAADEIEASP